MSHLSEQQLVLHYYGEEPQALPHLEQCSACRDAYREIELVLDACREFPVPEPQPAFEALMWQRLAPALEPRQARWKAFFTGFRFIVPAVAALLVAAFFLGRVSGPAPAVPVAQNTPAQGRERILLVALGDHLERSQMVLVELVNAKPGALPDLRLTQERARDLVTENRLYRQNVRMSGDGEFLSLLDDLERILTDVANSPDHITSPELQKIQSRIENRGLIFKLRVVDSNLQQKGAEKL